jgi:hypothetical protein
MNVPMMWAVWGALVVIMAAIYLYRSRLTRDEDDQIYLDDACSHEKAAQAEITAKVAKVEPILKVAKWLVVAATVFVIGYYLWDIASKFM